MPQKILVEITIEGKDVRIEVINPHRVGTATAVVVVPTSRGEALTPREVQILGLLAQGKSVKEVACDLNLSGKTVDVHKSNLMRKLDIHNTAQLVLYAVREEIIRVKKEPRQLQPLAQEPEPEPNFVIAT